MEADKRQECILPAQPSHPELGLHFSCSLAWCHPLGSMALACINLASPSARSYGILFPPPPYQSQWDELGTDPFSLPLLPLHHSPSVITHLARTPPSSHLQMHRVLTSSILSAFHQDTPPPGPFFLSNICQHVGQPASMRLTFSHPDIPISQHGQFHWQPSPWQGDTLDFLISWYLNSFLLFYRSPPGPCLFS